MKTKRNALLLGFFVVFLFGGAHTKAIAQTNIRTRAVVAWGGTVIPLVDPSYCYTAIAAGGQHSLALRPDGTVVAWGNGAGATVPEGLRNVRALPGGGYHTLALLSNGTVAVLGPTGLTNVSFGGQNVVAIGAGERHCLAVKSDGMVVSWGDWTGRVPAPTDLSNVVAVAGGGVFSLALKSDGTVAAWGENGIAGQTNVPVGLNSVKAIAAWGAHCLALKSNGTIVAWGDNRRGQCNVPPGLTGIAAIAAGANHSLALTTNGTVVAWGAGTNAVPSGIDYDYGQSFIPRELTNVMAIAASGNHSLALKSDGTVIAWGYNFEGQATGPGKLRRVVDAKVGFCHQLILKPYGTVASEGAGWYWNGVNYSPMIDPTGLSNVATIAAGGYHNLALKADGTVTAWGSNLYGQTNVPLGLNGVMAIAAGYYHNLALRSNGTVVAWGWSLYGQTNVPATLSGVRAIAAGGYHSLALTSNGTVIAWGAGRQGQSGDPHYGQSVVPMNLSGIIAVAGGRNHSLAIKSDGSVVAWGDISYGQCSVPEGLCGALAVAGETYYSAALKSDGTLLTWGQSPFGYVFSPPRGLRNVVEISATEGYTLAVVDEFLEVQYTPSSRTAEAGSTVRLPGMAKGYPPPSYQWFYNEATLVASNNNAHLEITNVTYSDSGSYHVVIANAAGAFTSAPAMLNVISPVARRPVPAINLRGEAGSLWILDYANELITTQKWLRLDTGSLSSTSQFYFELTTPLPPERFYRAAQLAPVSVVPSLDIHMVPALTLTGTPGDQIRVDGINAIGPTDAWFTLASVTLTNTPQDHFDVTAPGQPARLYRLVPVP